MRLCRLIYLNTYLFICLLFILKYYQVQQHSNLTDITLTSKLSEEATLADNLEINQ